MSNTSQLQHLQSFESLDESHNNDRQPIMRLSESDVPIKSSHFEAMEAPTLAEPPAPTEWSEWQPIDGYTGNDESEHFDEYDNRVPVDLSNDIAVNQMLADQGAPHDADAEIFNVDDYNFDGLKGSSSHNGYQQQKQSDEHQQIDALEYLPWPTDVHRESQSDIKK